MQNPLHRIAVLLLVVFFVVFNCTSVQTKPAAPPSGGVSGDPSRSTCAFIGCHPGPELSFSVGDIDLNMGTVQGSLSSMTGQTYIPGQLYFIELKPNVTNGNNTRYGFQATALDAAGNMAGAFTITDAVNNSAQSLLGRNYIGHKDASGFHDWNFKWTAPATNVGKVTFYYAVDDANNDGNTSGDKVYKGTTDLMPSTGTGISDEAGNEYQVTVFPSPARENVFVSFDSNDNLPVSLRVLSLDGKVVQVQSQYSVNTGKNVFCIHLNDEIGAGLYILELTSGTQNVASRFMVM